MKKYIMIILIIIVAIIGVTAGIALQIFSNNNKNYTLQDSTAINNVTNTTQNNTQAINNASNNNSGTNKEFLARTCPRCGATFYVPVYGEQLTMCEDCTREKMEQDMK